MAKKLKKAGCNAPAMFLIRLKKNKKSGAWCCLNCQLPVYDIVSKGGNTEMIDPGVSLGTPILKRKLMTAKCGEMV